MQLEHIKIEVCPDCGAKPIREEKDRQHTNGHWNESRRFACGADLSYSPNFKSIKVETECPTNPNRLHFLAARKKALENVRKVMAKQKCDDIFIQRMLSNIEYL